MDVLTTGREIHRAKVIARRYQEVAKSKIRFSLDRLREMHDLKKNLLKESEINRDFLQSQVDLPFRRQLSEARVQAHFEMEMRKIEEEESVGNMYGTRSRAPPPLRLLLSDEEILEDWQKIAPHLIKKNPRKLVRSVGDSEEVEFVLVVGEKGNEAANVTGLAKKSRGGRGGYRRYGGSGRPRQDQSRSEGDKGQIEEGQEKEEDQQQPPQRGEGGRGGGRRFRGYEGQRLYRYYHGGRGGRRGLPRSRLRKDESEPENQQQECGNNELGGRSNGIADENEGYSLVDSIAGELRVDVHQTAEGEGRQEVQPKPNESAA